MASDYTTNGRLEKIGTGEQAGTWGDTTNTNFDIIDKLTNGVKKSLSIAGATVGSPFDLNTANGAVSNGTHKVIEFTGTLTEIGGVKITPIAAEKLYFVKNLTSGGFAIRFMQSTGSGFGTTVDVANAKTAIIYADGTGNVSVVETGSDEFDEDVSMTKAGGVSLTLQTTATAIADGDSLGRLQFKAPNESDGNPQNIVTSAIETMAVGAFTGSANKTKISFKTSDGAGVLERAKIESADATTKASKIIITSATDTVAQDQVFGRLSFQAPLEAGGGYGILETAMIDAVAEEAYDATDNNTSLVFKTSLKSANSGVPQEKFRISSNGECGIYADGSTSSNNLRVGLHGDLKIYHDGNNSYINDTGTGILVLEGSQVSINHAASNKFTTTTDGISINGNCSVSLTLSANEVTASSDERLKSDIHTIDNALDKVMNMRGVSFTKQAERGVGVIAQEVEKVLPEVVHDGEYKSVAYGNMVGVLIEAIKEQQKQIDELNKVILKWYK